MGECSSSLITVKQEKNLYCTENTPVCTQASSFVQVYEEMAGRFLFIYLI